MSPSRGTQVALRLRAGRTALARRVLAAGAVPALVILLLAACSGATTSPSTAVGTTESPSPLGLGTIVEPAMTVSAPSTTVGTTTTSVTETTTTTEPYLSTTTTLLPPATVRVLLVGDVMLGRGLRRIVASDPDSVFAGVRDVITGAGIAAANLESSLTTRRHIAINPNALKADPASAAVLAEGGFDVMALANNHATDSGRSTVLDSIAALDALGIASAGAGPDQATAFTPLIMERDGITVAFLSFDVTLAAWPATPAKPGVSHWDARLVEPAVRAAADAADVVVVAIHGGAEYRTGTDPTMAAAAEQLAGWGADVVWGHGPHVVQPVYVIGGPQGRPVVVATSLGNFLFDMRAAGTQEGAILEVEAGRDGVLAFRVGRADHPDRLVVFRGWEASEERGSEGWIAVGGSPASTRP